MESFNFRGLSVILSEKKEEDEVFIVTFSLVL
jgi:hypothetical protein